MKIRLPKLKFKTSIVAIFFIFIMLFSTFAFSFLQTVWRPSEEEVTLPRENIIDYELTIEQEALALRLGKTIAKFYYYTGCLECGDRLSLLEYMAQQFSDQIIVEEILTDGTTSLSIRSYYGEKNLVDATQEQIFDAFCELMTKPPIVCATREV